MEESLELLFNIKVVDEYFFATIASMIDEEGYDGFGNGVVDVFLNNIIVGSDQAFYHLGFSLFAQFGVFRDFNDWGHAGQFIAGQVVSLRVGGVKVVRF